MSDLNDPPPLSHSGDAPTENPPIRTGPVVVSAPGPATRSPLVLQTLAIAALSGASSAGLAALLTAGWINPWAFLAAFAVAIAGLGLLGGKHLAQPYEQLADQLSRCAKSRSRRDAKKLPVSRTDEFGRIARAFIGLMQTAERDARNVKTMRNTMDEQVQRAIDQATRSINSKANRDPMTGLGNRRFLEEQLEGLVSASLESGTKLLALAIDLDHFKSVNDTLGHEAGDDAIKLAADLMRQGLRQEDLVIRLGGDEFLVLMPGGTHKGAERYTETLRSHFVQQAKVRFAGVPHTPNLSIGVANLNHQKHNHGDDLLRAADEQLYAAKRAGRGLTAGLITHLRRAG